MASISERDSYAFKDWPSHTYPFEAQQAGRMVYFGRAPAQVGSWEGTSPEIGYITLDGTLQTLDWKIPAQHRPVRLIVYHEDAVGNPSATNLSIDYYYREYAMGKWIRIGGGVSGAATYEELFGETHESRDVMYRLTLQGTDTHLVWVTPYNQYLQANQFYGRRQSLR